MSTEQTFVIVGGGLAGAKAAQALREEGFDGRVVLIGEEDVAPYERPPLSKDYLRGDADRDAIWALEEGWYEANDVELRTGTRAGELALDASEAVLAAVSGSDSTAAARHGRGAQAAADRRHGPRRRPRPAYGRRVRRAARGAGARGARVVIGAGWIGCEVAASASSAAPR